MNELKLPVDLVNAVMQYLGSRPFVEVAGLIQAIQAEAAKQGAQPEAASQTSQSEQAPPKG